MSVGCTRTVAIATAHNAANAGNWKVKSMRFDSIRFDYQIFKLASSSVANQFKTYKLNRSQLALFYKLRATNSKLLNIQKPKTKTKVKKRTQVTVPNLFRRRVWHDALASSLPVKSIETGVRCFCNSPIKTFRRLCPSILCHFVCVKNPGEDNMNYQDQYPG